jgi:hypothetical protein
VIFFPSSRQLEIPITNFEGEIEMKVQYCSLILIAVLTLTAFTMPALSDTTNQAARSEANTEYFVLSTNTTTEWCTVVLDNPRSNLNVRDSNGRIVAKLKYGASVYVDTYDGGFARVNVRRRGRLVTLGWVASEYLSC